MTYAPPNPPKMSKKLYNRFISGKYIDPFKSEVMNYSKYKTHLNLIKLNEFAGFEPNPDYYKCNDCGIELLIYKKIIFRDNVCTNNNLSCEEYIIKNIIE